jgi:thiamine-phosphate pyrophosphorylase
MLSDCTPAVTRALQAAVNIAQLRAAAEVQPIHVLLGLLDEAEGQAARMLQQLGVTAAAVREAFAAPPALSAGEAIASPTPMSLLVEKALARARELNAAAGADRSVASEQLVLGLLQIEPELVCLLEPLGLNKSRLAAELQARQLSPLQLDEPLNLVEPTERIDAARILDANANRAREALRVVEDYCRFVLDDAFLSGELKQLRHSLTGLLATWSPSLLLEARETQQDVGTQLSAEREHERQSLREVALVNLKRLQEALRCLEEVGKLTSADLGQALEQLRYRSYTLERAILLGSDARQRLADARLYVLLTGATCKAALDWTIQEAAAGGASIFQLREKNLTDRELLDRAWELRRWTREAGALFVMNDRPDIARLAEADGVHVGQEELPVKEVRRIVGPDILIGVSTHNVAQVRQAILDGASYIGIGPTFPSGTKEFAQFPGLDFVRQAIAETSLPAFVIGGVTLENIAAAVGAGARRVAVGLAICQAEDPRAVAAELCRALSR